MLGWRQNSWGLSSGDRPRRQNGRRQHAPCEARHSIKGDLPATNWRDPAAQQQELGLRHLHQFLRQQERSEEHTSELQSLMRISYAVFCLKKKKQLNHTTRE